MYPEWVKKAHIKGTSIKKIGSNYYLYKATSKYVKGKKPVSVQKYIGKITPEGLIEPEKISFIPGVDKIILVKDVVKETSVNNTIKNIPLIVVDGNYYCGKLGNKEMNLMKKHFKFIGNRLEVV